MKNKVGVVAMSNISVGGGYARVVVDLIHALNDLGKDVYLLTSSNIDKEKIKEFHSELNIKKLLQPDGFKQKFCKEDTISRMLIKNEFKSMMKEVDFVVDVDGRILDRYVPEEDKKRYIIWRVSCAERDTKKFPWIVVGFKRKIKEFVKDLFYNKRFIPSKNVKIYALDEWTKKELKDYWHRDAEDSILYPEIKVDSFIEPAISKLKKKKQIIVFGRIARNKQIDDSIKVFARGTKSFLNYNLVILGGVTPDSELYVESLKKLAEKEGVSKRVEFIENPSFERLKKILLESEILIDSQRGVSLTMTAIEAIAAEVITLAYKNSGTFQGVLEKGKYGFGFSNIDEGGEKLEEILTLISKRKLNGKKFKKRAEFYSGKNFRERLKKIIEINERMI